MQLNQKVYVLSVDDNLTGQTVKIILNGKESDLTVKDVFRKHHFEPGKLVGYSILEYFTVKDGLLTRDGVTVCFATEKHPKILIKMIRDPWIIDSEVNININYVNDVCKLLDIDADKLPLSIEEKKLKKQQAEEKRIADEKAAEEKRIADEKAAEEKRIADEKAAEEKRIADEKAAEEAKLKALEEQTVSEKDFTKMTKQLKKDGLEEYISEPYYFYYAQDKEEDKNGIVFVKRENGRYEELEGEIVEEDEDEVEYSFNDGETEKILTLNLKEGKIEIENVD